MVDAEKSVVDAKNLIAAPLVNVRCGTFGTAGRVTDFRKPRVC